MPATTAFMMPLFVGPMAFILGVVLIVAVVFIVVRLLLGLAWRVVVLAAIILVLLWALGVLGTGPPRAIPPFEAVTGIPLPG